MAKLPVTQQDGEIRFVPGGIKPTRTYQVVKGEIEVDDADLAEVAQALAPGIGALTPEQLTAATAGAEQAAYEQGKAQQAAVENAQAVADATAAGAARAAAETKKTPKSTPAPAG
jgi:hypothetical protein